MFTLGIDVGSASSKAVIVEDGKKILAHAVVQLGTGSSGPGKVMDEIFSISGILKKEIARTVVTGYGRFAMLKEADKQISEISCQAKGIHFLLPTARDNYRYRWTRCKSHFYR